MANKEFSWNRNAPTNRETVIQCAAISLAAAIVPTVCSTAVAISLWQGGILVAWAALAFVPTVFMACWLLLFLTMICVYNISNRGHEREVRPPHPTAQAQKKTREIKGNFRNRKGRVIFDE